MSNKTQLQTNNNALDGYIARINAAKEVAATLPEAGGGSGGGSIETYTGSISALMGPDLNSYTITYTDKNLDIQSVTAPSHPFTFEVVKNSIIFICGGTCRVVSGCENLGGGYGSYAYKIISNNFSICAEF